MHSLLLLLFICHTHEDFILQKKWKQSLTVAEWNLFGITFTQFFYLPFFPHRVEIILFFIFNRKLSSIVFNLCSYEINGLVLLINKTINFLTYESVISIDV